MTPLSKGALRSALDAIEHDLRAGVEVALGRFASARKSALHWAKHSGEMRTLRRLARLLAVTGEHREAIVLLKEAVALSPGDEQTAQLLSDALASRKKLIEALDVLSPYLETQSPNAGCLARAAKIHQRLGHAEQALQLSQMAANRNPERAGSVLAALIVASRGEEALSKARELLATVPDDPRVCHDCYTTLLKLGTDKEEIARARNRLLDCAGDAADRKFWLARMLRQEGDLEAGAAEIEAGLAAAPNSAPLIRERAYFALAQGHWGRDAAILLKARPFAPAFSELASSIVHADLLLQSYGGSLSEAAREPERFGHVTTPECVFERVVQTGPAPQNTADRSGLVMVAGSLAGGGAERILANTFRLLSRDRRFGWTKLYVSDLAHETAKDFYLPLTGLDRSEVVVLDQDCRVETPLCWLGPAHAQVSTRILERLKEDRPAVVHASLEPLTLLTGLAALLAGVPQIVLHTHNMRPTDLAIRHASRMRDCYRALLTRPEVSLVGCARACVEDYAKWLGLEDRSNTHVVHNGLDAEELIVTGNPGSRAELRAAYGIEPGATVIGTAIRFAEVKQPLLWVDAAADVLERWPGCRFVMFGDGDLRRTTEDYIRAKGLADHFVLPGRVADIYRRLPLLDLFVLSSRTEALPNVLLEAQAAGIPIVAFDVGGVAETMIAGLTGILVKDRSARALAAGILQALAAPEWRRNAVMMGPGFVREAFSTEKMICGLSDILLQTARPSSNRKAVEIYAAQ